MWNWKADAKIIRKSWLAWCLKAKLCHWLEYQAPRLFPGRPRHTTWSERIHSCPLWSNSCSNSSTQFEMWIDCGGSCAPQGWNWFAVLTFSSANYTLKVSGQMEVSFHLLLMLEDWSECWMNAAFMDHYYLVLQRAENCPGTGFLQSKVCCCRHHHTPGALCRVPAEADVVSGSDLCHYVTSHEASYN